MFMGYLDLDEYSETALRHELIRRQSARDAGLCDYCGRHPFTSPCKFPARHRDEHIENVPYEPCSGTFHRRRDYSLPPAVRYGPDGLKALPQCNHCGAAGTIEQDGTSHGEVLTSPVG